MSERELLGTMAATIWAGVAASDRVMDEQAAVDVALSLLAAVDRRMYPSVYDAPQAPAPAPTPAS